MADATDTYDPLYAVVRGVEGDVIVRWSELTEAEREQAWRDYEKAFGTASDNEDAKRATGHVLVMQPGDVLLCKLAELVYEPDEGDDDTDLHVNPSDFAAAKAMWFEPRGSMQ